MNKDSIFFSYAEEVNQLSYALFFIGAFFSLLIVILLLVFSIRYRRRSPHERGGGPRSHLGLEVLWSLVPFAILIFIFAWGSRIFMEFNQKREPDYRVTVLAKQWMWKAFHPNGKKEINSLHIPANKITEITLISQDVIHSFYVPKLRFKQDVLPERYIKIYVYPTSEESVLILCAEYCGTEHSFMRADLVTQNEEDFKQWLSERAQAPVELLQAQGRRIYQKQQCSACHEASAGALAPPLQGIWRRQVRLESGEVVTVDENYLRRSLFEPGAQVHRGYRPIMPTYRGQLKEEEVLVLIEYLKVL